MRSSCDGECLTALLQHVGELTVAAGSRMGWSAGANPAPGLAKHASLNHILLLQARPQREAQQSRSSLRSCQSRWSPHHRRQAWSPGQPARHTWQGRAGRRWRHQPPGRQGEAAAPCRHQRLRWQERGCRNIVRGEAAVSASKGSGRRPIAGEWTSSTLGLYKPSLPGSLHAAVQKPSTCCALPAGHPFGPIMAQWQLASRGGTSQQWPAQWRGPSPAASWQPPSRQLRWPARLR